MQSLVIRLVTVFAARIFSDLLHNNCGMPQSSVLDPILFLVYMSMTLVQTSGLPFPYLWIFFFII